MTAPNEATLQLAITRLIQGALPHSLESGDAPLYPTWEAATRIFDAIKPHLPVLPPAAPSAPRVALLALCVNWLRTAVPDTVLETTSLVDYLLAHGVALRESGAGEEPVSAPLAKVVEPAQPVAPVADSPSEPGPTVRDVEEVYGLATTTPAPSEAKLLTVEQLTQALWAWHDQSGAPLEVRSYLRQAAEYATLTILGPIIGCRDEEPALSARPECVEADEHLLQMIDAYAERVRDGHPGAGALRGAIALRLVLVESGVCTRCGEQLAARSPRHGDDGTPANSGCDRGGNVR